MPGFLTTVLALLQVPPFAPIPQLCHELNPVPFTSGLPQQQDNYNDISVSAHAGPAAAREHSQLR